MFLLPVQLSLLQVPSPAITPTNLLFNVVAGPGALVRYRRAGRLAGPLTRLLLVGTLPGVVLGACIRVFAIPGPRVFRNEHFDSCSEPWPPRWRSSTSPRPSPDRLTGRVRGRPFVAVRRQNLPQVVREVVGDLAPDVGLVFPDHDAGVRVVR